MSGITFPLMRVIVGNKVVGHLLQRGKARADQYDPATRALWHAMLLSIGNDRGYQRGWTAHKYKEKFGVFPPWGTLPEPINPTPEVLSWVRSRAIAYAKARQRDAA
jgi:DNA repair protein RadD